MDSRTTSDSVVLPLASQMGVKAIQRDIFIDNNTEVDAIREQMELLMRLAREKGFAVACGHPYPQTLQAIKEKMPEFEKWTNEQKKQFVEICGPAMKA